ncbi:MAG: hypothetical protein GY950_26015, partial [bacterium]|nr:hypothetical protein [bacterium]
GDIVVGSPVAGRQHVSLQPAPGMFVNTLALRNYPAGSKSAAGFLQEVKENTLQAFKNQGYQLEDLVDQVVKTRDMSKNPLFDTMMALQNMEVPDIDVPGLKISSPGFENQVSKFDLSLIAFEINKELHFTFEYRGKLFSRETLQRFTRYFKEVLIAVTASPFQRIAELEIVPREERQTILYHFNDTK